MRTGRGGVEATRPRPALDSPAHVWLQRGEHVHADIRARVASQPGWAIIGADAEHVVTDLADTADRVTELNSTISEVDLDQLAAERDRLGTQISTMTPAGQDDAEAREQTRTAYHAASRRLELTQRRIAERDALLNRMQAAVTGLEHCKHEVDNLLDEASIAHRESTAPILALTTRLAGLRAGLTVVEQINAGTDPDRTVPFAAQRPDTRPDRPARPPAGGRGYPQQAPGGHPE